MAAPREIFLLLLAWLVVEHRLLKINYTTNRNNIKIHFPIQQHGDVEHAEAHLRREWRHKRTLSWHVDKLFACNTNGSCIIRNIRDDEASTESRYWHEVIVDKREGWERIIHIMLWKIFSHLDRNHRYTHSDFKDIVISKRVYL